MQYTQNYSLRKPDLFEDADVRQLNSNADDIDNLLYRNRRISTGPEWDNTTQYNVGDLVVYEHVLYRCIESTIGAWDSTKWVTTHLTDEVITARGDFANQNIADEFDSTSTYEVGDYVIYEENLYKCTTAITVAGTWDSSNWTPCIITDEIGTGSAVVTKTAEGNPIEISDGASAPLVKCTTEITGSQDLHGYDKPWVGGSGKNKAITKSSSFTANNVTFTINADGSITLNGTADATGNIKVTDPITVNAGTTYTVSIGVSASVIGYGVSGFGIGTYTITPTNDYSDACVQVRTVSGTAYNTTIYPQLEVGSSATTFAPYANICPITAYTEGEIEVRGKNILPNKTYQYNTYNVFIGKEQGTDDDIWLKPGTYTLQIDCTNTSYHINYGVNGGGAIIVSGVAPSEWTFTVTEKSLYRFWLNDATGITVAQVKNFQLVKGSEPIPYEPYTSTTHTTTYPSAIYRGSEDCVNGEVTSEWGMKSYDGSESWYSHTSSNRWYLNQLPTNLDTENKALSISNQALYGDFPGVFESYFSFGSTGIYVAKLSSTETLEQFKSRLSSENMVVAYPLATPTTSSVTPTNLPIKSLSGYNHIESSTGDMEVEYITEDYQPLVDLIEEESGGSRTTKLWDAGFTPSPGVWLEYDFGENLESYDAIVIEFVVDGWEGNYSDSVTIYPKIQHLNTNACYHYVKGTDYGTHVWHVSGTTYALGAISGSYPPQYKAVYGIKY